MLRVSDLIKVVDSKLIGWPEYANKIGEVIAHLDSCWCHLAYTKPTYDKKHIYSVWWPQLGIMENWTEGHLEMLGVNK